MEMQKMQVDFEKWRQGFVLTWSQLEQYWKWQEFEANLMQAMLQLDKAIWMQVRIKVVLNTP
jgi:hypothetical protein